MKEMAPALVRAHQKFKTPAQTGYNNHLRANYSTIADYLSAVNHALWDNGLFLTQDAKTLDNGVSVVTRITHTSGETIESSPCTIPVTKQDAQAFGSAIAYARRYSLASFLSLAAGVEDDDGESLQQEEKEDPKQEAKKGKEIYPDTRFAQNLPRWRESIEAGTTTPEKIIQHVESVYAMTDAQKESLQ